jgi:hypothetical protein
MPNVMLSTIFQHALVLRDSLEILSQTAGKPCQVGLHEYTVFDGGSGGYGGGDGNDDDDDIYAKRPLQ